MKSVGYKVRTKCYSSTNGRASDRVGSRMWDLVLMKVRYKVSPQIQNQIRNSVRGYFYGVSGRLR